MICVKQLVVIALLVALVHGSYWWGQQKIIKPPPRKRRSTLVILDAVREAFLDLAKEKGLELNDKYHRAIDDIEKSVASERNRKYTHARIRQLSGVLVKAASMGNLENFRRILGRALYANLTKHAATATTWRRNGKKNEARLMLQGAKHFLTDIRKNIGEENFEDLISINGQVTLVFVMDATGSMHEEIDAAKAIATEIINYKREVPVTFMLSVFKDPDVAPIVFRDESELGKALDDLTKLKPSGGGDCPEATFRGIRKALFYSPMPGSAMYVFTDAGPNDDNEENMETVRALAVDMGIPIYFFYTNGCGSPSKNLKSFRVIAEDTGGFVFPLVDEKQIKNLSMFVKENLKGSGTISTGGATTNPPPTTKVAVKMIRYTIPFDDTVDKAVITVSFVLNKTINMKRSYSKVRLLSPKKQKIAYLQDLVATKIFEVKKPEPGNWTLLVPHRAGAHKYFVKTFSKVDFSHYYYRYVAGPRSLPSIYAPISHPIIGKNTSLMIQIPEIARVDEKSLVVAILYKNGTHGGFVDVKKLGDSGTRFTSVINVHAGAYKLQLSGKTTQGYQFSRLATQYEEGKPFLLRVVYARSYTLPVGKNSTLLMLIDNPWSITRNFTYNVTDTFGYTSSEKLHQKGPTSIAFQIEFSVPPSGTKNIGQSNKVIISATALIPTSSGLKKVTSTVIQYLLITAN